MFVFPSHIQDASEGSWNHSSPVLITTTAPASHQKLESLPPPVAFLFSSALCVQFPFLGLNLENILPFSPAGASRL